MISVVSFDFFSLSDYFDFEMLETEPWSPNFAFLLYGSVNFIEGAGSILIVGLLTIILGLLAILSKIFSCKIPCKRLESVLQPSNVVPTITLFCIGTFFEILVCISISMRMLDLYEYFSWTDHLSVAFQFTFLVAIIVFIAFVIYFTFKMAPQLVTMTNGNNIRARQDKLKVIRQNFKRRASRLN